VPLLLPGITFKHSRELRAVHHDIGKLRRQAREHRVRHPLRDQHHADGHSGREIAAQVGKVVSAWPM